MAPAKVSSGQKKYHFEGFASVVGRGTITHPCLPDHTREENCLGNYLRRIRWTIASRMMEPSRVTSMVGIVIASLIVPTWNRGLRK